MNLRLLALVASFSPYVLADIGFISPAAGDTITVTGSATTMKIKWKDSGDSPSMSDLTTYQLFLCAGGNTADTYDQLFTITDRGIYPATDVSAVISTGLGGDDENAYFLKIISTASTGGTVTNFSPRFTLSGMTGVWSAKVQAAIPLIEGTDGPSKISNVGGAAGAPDASMYNIPFTKQSGATYYAPMQPMPPTSITAQSRKMQFPTSSVVKATTFLSIPTQQKTLTMQQTFSVSSQENPASRAPDPSDDWQKFLNRWKD